MIFKIQVVSYGCTVFHINIVLKSTVLLWKVEFFPFTKDFFKNFNFIMQQLDEMRCKCIVAFSLFTISSNLFTIVVKSYT